MKAATKSRVIRLLMAVAFATALAIPALAAQDGPGYSFGDQTAKNDACLSCHADGQKVKGRSLISQAQFAHTTHARIGCPSCHDAIGAGHPDGKPSAKASCQQCHADVNSEYALSIHAGKAACAGCHNPHKVESPREISGMEINEMCGNCHDKFKMSAKHGEWLPQADLHLYMLPCITCHTGSKNYFVSMYIVSTKNETRLGKPEVASFEELHKMAKFRDILTLVDTNGDNYVSLAELRSFNKNPEHKSLRLQGMMTPETVSHKFEILDNRRNCTFCHGSGPGVMQTSVLALPEENGTFRRVSVEKGAALDALYGTPDFYMMGSNKSTTMSILGLAIICGGLIMPVCHGTLRFLTRKNRVKKEHHS